MNQAATPWHMQQATAEFNAMYSMPQTGTVPTLGTVDDAAKRIGQFEHIMGQEVAEGALIRKLLWGGLDAKEQEEVDKVRAMLPEDTTDQELALVMLADWLGDIAVYAYSEAQRFGINLTAILYCIMQSNASKMGADGQPIYDEFGKLQKGPDYWKPEPVILATLRKLQESASVEEVPSVP